MTMKLLVLVIELVIVENACEEHVHDANAGARFFSWTIGRRWDLDSRII